MTVHKPWCSWSLHSGWGMGRWGCCHIYQENLLGFPLGVQWLRLHTSPAGGCRLEISC